MLYSATHGIIGIQSPASNRERSVETLRKPVRQIRNLFAMACLLAGIAVERSAAAVTIVWDGEVGATALASDGVTGWGSQYVIDLGVFDNGFTPTATNLGDWGANWLSLGTTNYNPAPGGDAGSANFAGSVVLADNIQFASGAQVYMWVRDGMAISEYGQWLLVTDDVASVGDDWLIPDTTGSDQTTPAVTWSLFCDATEQTVVFGGVESGGTGGEWVAPATEWCYQTHFVPEPAGTTALLLPVLFVLGVTRRREISKPTVR
jgi:hypothetical protein